MNITPKNNPKEFDEFLFNVVNIELYKHKFLNDYLRNAKIGNKPLYDDSIINVSDNGWVLILHGETLIIYGQNWNINQLLEIKETFDLNKFTNFVIRGDSELIFKLIKQFELKNFNILKKRILYKANEIVEFKNEKLKIELGNLDDMDELSRMLQDYYHEEYNGLNEKTISDMRNRIFSLIHTQNIYVLKDTNNKILSFCTLIDPDIGILFTKNNYRCKGYGKIILSFCAKLLNNKNGPVYLMTDRDKVASNKISETVGFIPYENYLMAKINCG